MAKSGIAARQAAWAALARVVEAREMLRIEGDLSPAEMARSNRLAQATLRYLGRLDSVIGKHLQRPPKLSVRLLLRLGAAELLIEGQAPHGVVDSYVTLAKSRPDTRRAAGLVNAVLRRVAEQGPELWARQGPQRMPNWLGGRLASAYGKSAVTAMEAAHEAGAPIDLTPRGGHSIPDAQTLPTGSLRLPQGTQVSALPGYDTGAFWVQDAAAALPVRLFGDVAGLAVLDLCAAPGGKTLQLAAAGAQVTALDNSEPRLERLHENLARTGLTAEIVTADARSWRGGPYDAILLDAPCSATGTIRRHPELPLIRDGKSLAPLLALQSELIDAALAQLKPGGRLIYCTCSLLPEEGEAQIDAALARHPDFKAIAVDPATLGGGADWAAAHGALRLRPDFWPELGGMDGFYMALLEGR